LYELYSRGQLVHRFRPDDDDLWRTWLAAHTAVVFQGHSGRINLHHEPRTRTTRYWYAYHATRQRAKRYLGPTANLTFERLEQVAGELSGAHVPAPRASHAPSLASGAQLPAVVSDAARKAEERVVLLATKLAPPRVGAGWVGRERLLVQMDDAPPPRLPFLSPPAAGGKPPWWPICPTRHRLEARDWRLADSSLASSPQPLAPRLAWLSLDALDNEQMRFWVAIIAALRTCLPDVGELALSMLHAPEPPLLPAILTALLNDLASVAAERAPIVLILDDYHVIDDPAIYDGLRFFVEHLPEQVHLVLASLVDPALPLSRWRVQGALLELRAADLRFSAAEASTFFSQALGAGLTEDDVQRLEQRTEGWIAGLQL